MLSLPKVLITSALFATTPNSPLDWAGNWEYSDCWEQPLGGQKECVWYRLRIKRNTNGFAATLKVDGHMAASVIEADIKQKGLAIQIVFKRYIGHHLANEFKPGEVLFELVSNSGGIYTTWVAMQPSYTRLPAIQFEHVKGSSR